MGPETKGLALEDIENCSVMSCGANSITFAIAYLIAEDFSVSLTHPIMMWEPSQRLQLQAPQAKGDTQKLYLIHSCSDDAPISTTKVSQACCCVTLISNTL